MDNLHCGHRRRESGEERDEECILERGANTSLFYGMWDRATVLRELTHAFGPGTARQGLNAGEFQALIANAERGGLILTLAALLADRSRCLDDHSRLAYEWARSCVEAMRPVDSTASRRKLQRERCSVEGLLAVLDALVSRQESQRDQRYVVLTQLRHRASLRVLWLQLLSVLPEDVRAHDAGISDTLEMRAQELRKRGLVLLYDKLESFFVRQTRASNAGIPARGPEQVVAALIDMLEHSRAKWREDTQRGAGDSETTAPEFDQEQLAREAGYERAARVSLLYSAAQVYYSKALKDAASEHTVLVQQEQNVDKLRCALGGTCHDTAAALALFWLDAVKEGQHVHHSTLFLCRPGVAGVLGSLHISASCHRFLALGAQGENT